MSLSQSPVMKIINYIMTPIGFVYLTTNLINGKFYVGQRKLLKDKKENANYIGSGGEHFQRALIKHGRKNFKRKVLKLCYTENQLNVWETYYSKKYNPSLDKEIGYNKCHGPVQVCGNKNPACHPDVKERMIEINRRTTSNSEYRKKQSEIMIEYYKNGGKNNFEGKHHTEESKQKQRDKMKGRVAHNKGIPISENQKCLQSIAMKGKYVGENNPNYGKKWNEERRQNFRKIKESQCAGIGNPNYGKMWINDGTKNKPIDKDFEIPEGWVKGMIKYKTI